MRRMIRFGMAAICLIALLETRAEAQREVPKPDASDVKYGAHDRDLLDFWKAKSESGQPTPLVVFIHGGGFQGGDKKGVPADLLADCLEAGISVASINYRLSSDAPFPAPMLDGARAIQFLRSKADRWGIEPDRIAASGGSAGAGISLWIGFHDDLADPESDDPIARQSTRLVGMAVLGAQSSYDPRFIKEHIGGRAHEHPALRPFYGLGPDEPLDSPRVTKLYEEASAINYVSADDPPVFLYYQEPKGPLPDDSAPGKGIHHPNFGIALQEALEPLGVACTLRHRDDYRKSKDPQEAMFGDMMAFFRDRFEAPPASDRDEAPAPSAREERPNGRPNILFAMADDWSWPHAGAYGCRFVKTPAFDRVAREGVLFHRAFCASPGCSPSRAAILTGRPTWQLAEAGTHASSFPKDLQVYPDLLEGAGYHVGYTGKGWGPGNFKVSGWERNPAGPAYSKRKAESAPAAVSKEDYSANFQAFLDDRPDGKPFCFWYGGQEPHRAYAKGAGLRAGKQLDDVEVPPFLPDTPEVRSDLLDYAVEVEYFDQHLGQMLETLERSGELDRTLVLVASDNGMPFPRAKANLYEYGTHMPMAVRWPGRAVAGRAVDDFANHIDLAPTFLEAAGLEVPAAMVGRSLVSVLASEAEGQVDPARDRTFTARERHSSSRPDNLGYPCRALRTADYLYIRNFAPDRWPAGDPQGVGGDPFGFYDIDGSPTEELIVEHKDDPRFDHFYHLAVAKRPAEELFDIRSDPATIENLAGKAQHAEALSRLRTQLDDFLRATGDPRLVGDGEIFESYRRYSPIREFR